MLSVLMMPECLVRMGECHRKAPPGEGGGKATIVTLDVQELEALYGTECATQKTEVMDLGGLHVIGTERHESRRIDNQLRGRTGRQGDPGSTRFFLSLEDNIFRIFGGDKIQGLMSVRPSSRPPAVRTDAPLPPTVCRLNVQPACFGFACCLGCPLVLRSGGKFLEEADMDNSAGQSTCAHPAWDLRWLRCRGSGASVAPCGALIRTSAMSGGHGFSALRCAPSRSVHVPHIGEPWRVSLEKRPA